MCRGVAAFVVVRAACPIALDVVASDILKTADKLPAGLIHRVLTHARDTHIYVESPLTLDNRETR